jgi:CDP-6-deoxy-D-xylo-4-hexulose-3-dehydrase
MKLVVDLCNKYNVILLEDVCESMGSKYNQQYLGSFGFASVFSTYFGHHISTIEGGFINTNDEEFYNALLMIRSHGWDRDLNNEKKTELRERYNISNFDSLYTFYVPGLNLRSTDLQAFIGLRAIDKLDEYSRIRNENFNTYFSKIKNNDLKLKVNERDYISNFAYPVVTKDRDLIVQTFQENNIEVRPLIAGNIANKPFWYNKYGHHEFQNANIIDKYGFYVPNHQSLTYKNIELISNIKTSKVDNEYG